MKKKNKNTGRLLFSHGGYRKLKSFQMATIIYDFTVEFCRRYVSSRSYRTSEQMVQAARSGRQNIAEGCTDSGTSKKSELKLIGVARGSLEELLLDYEDFLRQRNLPLWSKDSSKVKGIRALAYKPDKSYKTYQSYLKDPETAANCAVVLINQANFLLDRQMQSLEKDFLAKGGFTERLYRQRKKVL